MKDYISAGTAAERWGVSLRRVHQYCHSGRVDGAQKYGNCWMIPENAPKPSDPRLKSKPQGENKPEYLTCGLLSFNKPMKKEGAADASFYIGDEKQREQYNAELSYMCGDFESVKKYYETVATEDEVYFLAASITACAAMSTGDYKLFAEINRTVKQIENDVAADSVRIAAELFAGLITTSANAPEISPKWLKTADFDGFPYDSRAMLVFLRVKYLQSVRDWFGMLSAAQAGLLLLSKKNELTALDIYLTCLCSCANYAINRTDEARLYLDKAVAMCVPAGITAPLREYNACVGGMLEIALKKCPAEFEKSVLRHIEETFNNWLFFHNEFAKANVSLILTPREYRIAVLLKEGKTYEQIAKQLCLSVGRVRNLISAIYEKLGISKRAEISQYVY